VSVKDEIDAMYEMGPGGNLSEGRAARTAIEHMRRACKLKPDEYFTGDTVYAVLDNGIYAL